MLSYSISSLQKNGFFFFGKVSSGFSNSTISFVQATRNGLFLVDILQFTLLLRKLLYFCENFFITREKALFLAEGLNYKGFALKFLSHFFDRVESVDSLQFLWSLRKKYLLQVDFMNSGNLSSVPYWKDMRFEAKSFFKDSRFFTKRYRKKFFLRFFNRKIIYLLKKNFKSDASVREKRMNAQEILKNYLIYWKKNVPLRLIKRLKKFLRKDFYMYKYRKFGLKRIVSSMRVNFLLSNYILFFKDNFFLKFFLSSNISKDSLSEEAFFVFFLVIRIYSVTVFKLFPLVSLIGRVNFYFSKLTGRFFFKNLKSYYRQEKLLKRKFFLKRNKKRIFSLSFYFYRRSKFYKTAKQFFNIYKGNLSLKIVLGRLLRQLILYRKKYPHAYKLKSKLKYYYQFFLNAYLKVSSMENFFRVFFWSNAVFSRSKLLTSFENKENHAMEFFSLKYGFLRRQFFFWTSPWMNGALSNFFSLKRTLTFFHKDFSDFKSVPSLIFLMRSQKYDDFLAEVIPFEIPMSGFFDSKSIPYFFMYYVPANLNSRDSLFFYFVLILESFYRGYLFDTEDLFS